MLSVFTELSAFAVFLSIAGLGFLFLLFSLVFGEIVDHFDTSLDHDLGHGGPGFFSTRVMSVFITTFGGVGAIGTYYGMPPVGASAVGFVAGLALASVIYAFARFLFGQQASSDVRSDDLLGQTCRVVITIPAGGVGQIRCRLGEELVDKIARSHDGQPIAEHTTVRVEDAFGDTVVVKRMG